MEIITVDFSFIPFVLMWNDHFLNYYVPLRNYVRKPSLSRFDSISSDQLYLTSPLTSSISHFTQLGYHNKG